MRLLAVGLLALGLVAGAVTYSVAEPRDQPAGPPGPGAREQGDRPAGDRGPGDRGAGDQGHREFHVLPPGAKEALKLTTDQEQQIAELDKDVQAKMAKILTTEQQDQWNKARPPGPPPGRRGDRAAPGPDGARGAGSARGTDGPRSGADTRRRPPADGPGEAGGPRGGPGGLDRLVGELRLKDDQKDKVQEILKAHHEKMMEVMKEQRAELVKNMKSVLTDEQLQTLEKSLPEPGIAGPPRDRGNGDGPPRGR